jgi:hypothetical protein
MNTQDVTNTPTNQTEIAIQAYQLWEREGSLPGRDQEYWFRAEAEVRTRAPRAGRHVLSIQSPTVQKPKRNTGGRPRNPAPFLQ